MDPTIILYAIISVILLVHAMMFKYLNGGGFDFNGLWRIPCTLNKCRRVRIVKEDSAVHHRYKLQKALLRFIWVDVCRYRRPLEGNFEFVKLQFVERKEAEQFLKDYLKSRYRIEEFNNVLVN